MPYPFLPASICANARWQPTGWTFTSVGLRGRSASGFAGVSASRSADSAADELGDVSRGVAEGERARPVASATAGTALDPLTERAAGLGRCGLGKRQGGRGSRVTVYDVPYSEHSSFGELKSCVRALNPVRIIPTVSCVCGTAYPARLRLLRPRNSLLPLTPACLELRIWRGTDTVLVYSTARSNCGGFLWSIGRVRRSIASLPPRRGRLITCYGRSCDVGGMD